MGAHVVELAEKAIEASLLRVLIPLWMLADPILERSVHPFVNAILLGMARLDANRSDPQLDPPAR